MDPLWPLRQLQPLVDEAGEYLFYVLAGDETFVVSGDAERILAAFRSYVESKAYAQRLSDSLAELVPSMNERMQAYIATLQTPAVTIRAHKDR